MIIGKKALELLIDKTVEFKVERALSIGIHNLVTESETRIAKIADGLRKTEKDWMAKELKWQKRHDDREERHDRDMMGHAKQVERFLQSIETLISKISPPDPANKDSSQKTN